jgi:glucose/mannose transport system substrate-binding protein
MVHKASITALACTTLLFAGAARAADPVEVLHYWTSSGEAAAADVLKKAVEARGVPWTDMSITGSGSETAADVLRDRVTRKVPPTAAQVDAAVIQSWAKVGALADLDPLAVQEKWDSVTVPEVQSLAKYKGKWVAVPVGIHTVNWLWGNKAVLEGAGIKNMPVDWEEFIADLAKLKKKGIVGFAISQSPREHAQLFEVTALATGGLDFYRKAFFQRDRATLTSATMRKVFERVGQVRAFTAPDLPDKTWDAATGSMAQGRAGFTVMGDWAKGEFAKAGKVTGVDIWCAKVPGTKAFVSYVVDMFAMFNLGSGGIRRQEAQASQAILASTLMNRDVQAEFSRIKGSVPPRLDAPSDKLDSCGKVAMQDLATASKSGQLTGVISSSMTLVMNKTFKQIASDHFLGKIDSATAIKQLEALQD